MLELWSTLNDLKSNDLDLSLKPQSQVRAGGAGICPFDAPDMDNFPALGLARDALKAGGSAPTILNAANEIAVHGFLDRRTRFLDIARIVERTLEIMPQSAIESLDNVRRLDIEARRIATEVLEAGFESD